MKSAQGLVGIGITGLVSGSVLLLTADGAIAAAKVTGVQLDPTPSGVTLVLKTEGGDRPQVFSVNRGNTWTADLVNTRLQLPGGSFQKENPVAGITRVTIAPVDANTVRITVIGQGSAPTAQVDRSSNGALTFKVNRTKSVAANPKDAKPNVKPASKPVPLARTTQQPDVPAPAALPSLPNTLAQATTPPPAPVAPPSNAPAPTQTNPLPQNAPLVPNPTIQVQGRPYTPPPPVPPYAPVPLPRAVAPPVGDMAVGQIDGSPATIDLGTAEIIPRLVLRDASAREALALLARAAGLNLAYVPLPLTEQQRQQQQQQQQQADISPRITLDIQNEPVQNVFNYVLRIANLEANRVGRTVFVSPRLPDTARNLITRTIRLNQAAAATAATFLTSFGASTIRAVDRIRIEEIGTGVNRRFVEVREPAVVSVEIDRSRQNPLASLVLEGLSIAADDRLNTITVTGSPRKVEIATSLLTQLDARRRQVAVNVRIIDVNLLNTELANTSFSFGVGSSFFTVDRGAAVFNFGRNRPPTATEAADSLTSQPVTRNIFPTTADGFESINLTPFVDASQPAAPFGSNPLQVINNGRAPFGTPNNPYLPGATQVTATNVTYGLPSLFQFPTRFLAQLQAQVTSGNAKILTDPTLTVQEGETSTVQLTQQVVSRVINTITDTTGGSRQVIEPQLVDAGLTLGIEVPRVDDNGFISMRIIPEVSSPTQVVDVGGGQSATLLSRRRVQSGTIRVRDGQTLILAGIIQDTDRSTIRKIPILGDIPILGALFRSNQRDNQRQEVIVLVTPRILNDSDTSAFGYSYTPGVETQRVIDRANNRR